MIDMGDGVGQVRLAIAVFEHPARLRSAVAVLLDEGTGLEQICLVALPSTMIGLRQLVQESGSATSDLAVLIEHLVDWPDSPFGHGVVATASPLVAALPHVLDGKNIVKTQLHSPVEDGQLLSQHIRDGGVALIVGSATPSQQAANTRVLLAHSAQSVKTYEFTLPKSVSI